MLNYTFPRLEQAKEAESKDALKDLVNLITSLTTYGVSDLKPAGLTTGAPFLLPGFAVPQPAGKGESNQSHLSLPEQTTNEFAFGQSLFMLLL
jgi:hypothetical protein